MHVPPWQQPELDRRTRILEALKSYQPDRSWQDTITEGVSEEDWRYGWEDSMSGSASDPFSGLSFTEYGSLEDKYRELRKGPQKGVGSQVAVGMPIDVRRNPRLRGAWETIHKEHMPETNPGAKFAEQLRAATARDPFPMTTGRFPPLAGMSEDARRIAQREQQGAQSFLRWASPESGSRQIVSPFQVRYVPGMEWVASIMYGPAEVHELVEAGVPPADWDLPNGMSVMEWAEAVAQGPEAVAAYRDYGGLHGPWYELLDAPDPHALAPPVGGVPVPQPGVTTSSGATRAWEVTGAQSFLDFTESGRARGDPVRATAEQWVNSQGLELELMEPDAVADLREWAHAVVESGGEPAAEAGWPVGAIPGIVDEDALMRYLEGPRLAALGVSEYPEVTGGGRWEMLRDRNAARPMGQAGHMARRHTMTPMNKIAANPLWKLMQQLVKYTPK